MEAKDTVMDGLAIAKIEGEWYKILPSARPSLGDMLAGAQAEISFKAGIREAAAYIARNLEWASEEDEMIWTDQLRYWGIEWKRK